MYSSTLPCEVRETVIIICLAATLRMQGSSQPTGQGLWGDIREGSGQEVGGRTYFFLCAFLYNGMYSFITQTLLLILIFINVSRRPAWSLDSGP